MSRYQALRRAGCDPVAAGFVAFMNWFAGVRAGEVRFLHMTIEYDAKEAP